jgi:hypothetical protein
VAWLSTTLASVLAASHPRIAAKLNQAEGITTLAQLEPQEQQGEVEPWVTDGVSVGTPGVVVNHGLLPHDSGYLPISINEQIFTSR